MPSWMYSKGNDGIYVNLFAGSTVTLDNIAGVDVKMVQQTNYPWDGKVAITVSPTAPKRFTVRVRVPNRDVSVLYTSTPEANGITSIAVNGAAASRRSRTAMRSSTARGRPATRSSSNFP
jgi:DUF1680 family protein